MFTSVWSIRIKILYVLHVNSYVLCFFKLCNFIEYFNPQMNKINGLNIHGDMLG